MLGLIFVNIYFARKLLKSTKNEEFPEIVY
jgi:hypothetical protein